ncbi:MAG: hypothetical protein E6R03_17395 [Hyphomicrobiaceae bacterium]|nr:MAG: hypothetical protein E6R03_17395 [Hyphomicrobiaceae bacterium]
MLAAPLTDERRRLLLARYPKLPPAWINDLFARFAEKGEYAEWALAQLAKWSQQQASSQDPNDPLDVTTLSQQAETFIRRLVRAATWFDQAKTVKDPRVESHPEFNQKQKWDIRGYAMESLEKLQDRFVRVFRPRDLFSQFQDPVEVVAEKEYYGHQYTLVELDATGYVRQGMEELREAKRIAQGFREQVVVPFTEEFGHQIPPQFRDILTTSASTLVPYYTVSNKGDLELRIETNTVGKGKKSPEDTTWQGPLYQAFTDAVAKPLAALGYLVRGFEREPHVIAIFPPAIRSFLKNLCSYADAAEVENEDSQSWCTSDPRMGAMYLAKGSFHLVFKDGRPIAQYHGATSQFQTTDRTELHDDELETGNLDYQDASVVRKLIEQYTDYTPPSERQPEINWEDIRRTVVGERPELRDDYSDAMYDVRRWIDEPGDVEVAMQDLKWATSSRYDPKWSESLSNYLTFASSWENGAVDAVTEIMRFQSVDELPHDLVQLLLKYWGTDEDVGSDDESRRRIEADAFDNMLDRLRDEANAGYEDAEKSQGSLELIHSENAAVRRFNSDIAQALDDEDLDRLTDAIRTAYRSTDHTYDRLWYAYRQELDEQNLAY